MNQLLNLIKTYVSTSTFLLLSVLIPTLLYIEGGSNKSIQLIVEAALPINGKPLAVITLLGLIFVHECNVKSKKLSEESRKLLASRLDDVMLSIERRHLISDINSAFTEFKSSGKTNVTGKYYIKEILTLHEKLVELRVNSYSQSKIEYLVSVILYE